MQYPLCPRCKRRGHYPQNPLCGSCMARTELEEVYAWYNDVMPMASRSAHDVVIRSARIPLYAKRAALGLPLFGEI
jgi:hypothetical protein